MTADTKYTAHSFQTNLQPLQRRFTSTLTHVFACLNLNSHACKCLLLCMLLVFLLFSTCVIPRSRRVFLLLSALFLNSTLKQDLGVLPEEQFALGGCVNALVLLRKGFVVPALSIPLRLMARRGRAPPLPGARDPRS